jgi:C2 domain
MTHESRNNTGCSDVFDVHHQHHCIMVVLTALMLQVAAGVAAVSYSVWIAIQGLHALLPKGPQIIVEVIGADLKIGSSRFIDHGWTRPDPQVIIRHGAVERMTQVEYNELSPRFMYSTKIPYRENRGFSFTVMDVDMASDDDFIGRAFVDPATAKYYMRMHAPITLSLGDGIGILKVKIKLPDKSISGRRSLAILNEL